MAIKEFYALVKQTVTNWLDDYAPSMGAAIAFYTVFSLAPLLIIVIGIAGFFWGREAAQGQLLDQVSALVGPEGGKAVESVVLGAQEPAQGIAATVISLVMLAVGATTVFSELQSALDRIWKVNAQKQSGIWALIRARPLSFGLILTLAFLLVVSLVVSTVLAALGSWLGGDIPGWGMLLQAVNAAITLGILTLLFGMIYRFMPQVPVAWRDVWAGAFVTGVMFEIGKFLIGLYMAKASVASSYAAAGSLVIVLIWVYYAAQVFLLGAEFTRVNAEAHGSRRERSPASPTRSDA
ncbi:YihY/virulence factor BrkB family protein [Achromobacter sp. Root565]|uniref:YihY/virulence factor BrkB family protein n=1 Tax=Achromobacter sp. Root565 TaxID=1736564 RepID=UPI0006F833CA|nr:YihY/virulence factor BrkB family protein [Achromobacter sp. Root565]KRA01253.1 ribonuclease BN [Achromobacter sp. Root565]